MIDTHTHTQLGYFIMYNLVLTSHKMSLFYPNLPLVDSPLAAAASVLKGVS